MSLPHLSLADARNLHLAAQGLLNKPRRRASLEDIPATISRMSLLQIDTINIVARSPYLVLFSRLGNYPAQCNFAFFSGLFDAQFWAGSAQPKSPELTANY